jgi:hypothetical protein
VHLVPPIRRSLPLTMWEPCGEPRITFTGESDSVAKRSVGESIFEMRKVSSTRPFLFRSRARENTEMRLDRKVVVKSGTFPFLVEQTENAELRGMRKVHAGQPFASRKKGAPASPALSP